ncbi:MAG: glycosyltransferase family 4 protein [Oscillibacter sp.]|nr:glycosyltransferase family 4 protein [Oscillibacter sp.]
MLKTAQYLRARGIDVAIGGSAAGMADFDLIHFWGLSPMESLYPVFFHAVRSGRPIVLTPIYWDLGRYYAAMGSFQRLRLWNEQRPLRREIAAGSARVFVSGEKEALALTKDVGASLPCTVVPCGIDTRLFGGAPDVPGTRVGVLCAARIGPRKNQIALAQQCALRRLPLILAGPAGNPAYLNRCLQYQNVQYVGAIPPQRLAALYRSAQIHALVGYAETPGLASLEAAACGCRIVTTTEGTTEAYFEEYAAYCDPYDPGSIGAALDAAAQGESQTELRSAILKKFSWETCLAPLPEVYQSLI